MSMETTPDFFSQGLENLDAGFFSRTPRLLSLDFDGTLAPIAPTPSSVRLPVKSREILWALSLLPETKVAILSGRSLPDLRERVGVSGLVLAGNHGLDFSPLAAGWSISEFSGWTRQVSQVRSRLEPLLRHWPGAILEAKGPDLSLHYRLMEPARAERLIPQALGALEGLPVVSRRGKCVLEIRPEGAPGKGEALVRMANRYLGRKKGWCCVHVGDDDTDEEAFSALRRMGGGGLGLKVGEGPTLAHYRLAGLSEVHRFLNLFLDKNGV